VTPRHLSSAVLAVASGNPEVRSPANYRFGSDVVVHQVFRGSS
jgi:predicted fused transcriptional regulator/phosphomethylpyrimidine kinase